MRRFIFLALLVLLVPAVADAATIKIGETVFATANELVPDNAYVAAGQATLSSRFSGDVVAALGKGIVNGPVEGDLAIIAGSADILEHVTGDVRVLGGQVTISGSVGGDVVLVGGSIHILPGAAVSGDLIVAGGEIVIEGAVNGSVRLYGSTVTVDNIVGGPVSIRAGERVTFGEHAVVPGPLTYAAPSEATVDPGAKLGDNVTFKELDISARSLGPNGLAALLAAAAGFILITKLLVTIVTAVALVLVFPGFSHEIVEGTFKNFWISLGIGFAAMVIAPVAIVLLAVTIVGFLAAVILGITFVLMTLIAGIYGGIVFGALLAKRIRRRAEYGISWKWALLGSFALALASLVPFVGWLFVFVFYLAALGAIAMSIYRRALGGM